MTAKENKKPGRGNWSLRKKLGKHDETDELQVNYVQEVKIMAETEVKRE